MSGQVITELFQQIFHSEEKIKQRFEDLKKVNQKIQEHQEGLKTSKYERDAMQGKLNIVRHKLIEEQLEYKWLETRRQILSDQKDECLREKNKLTSELEGREKLRSSDRSSFIQQCEEFLDEFKVGNDNFDFKHQDLLDEKLKEAKHEKDKLLNELEDAEEKLNQRNKLRKEKENRKDSLQKKIKEKEETAKYSINIAAELKHLRKAKGKLSTNHACSDQTAQRLSLELEKAKELSIVLIQQNKELSNELCEQQQQTDYPNEQQVPQTGLSSNPWHVSKKPQHVEYKTYQQQTGKRFQYRPIKRKNTNDQPIRNQETTTIDNELLFTQSSQPGKSFDFNVSFSKDENNDFDDFSLADLSPEALH